MRSFPQLLIHCYRFCVDNLVTDNSLVVDYKLHVSRQMILKAIKSDPERKEVMTDLLMLDIIMETIPYDDDV